MKRAATLFLALAAAVPAQRIVLQSTTILDGKGGTQKDRHIVVENGKIVAVEKGGGKATYDLSGLTVMPGFIDTHVHLSWHFDANNRLEQGGREQALYTAANAWTTLQG